MSRVSVIDVGLGNIGSIRNMLDRLGAEVDVVSAPSVEAVRWPLVLPGVGAFDSGVRKLRESGWLDQLASAGSDHPILGICLGMQLLGESSEEGDLEGVGRIPARFSRFDPARVKVPHMGWNQVDVAQAGTFFDGLPEDSRFYFTHSYRAPVDGLEDYVVATAEYENPFTAAYRSSGTFGVQFHPEKSHRFGMTLLRAWMDSQC